MVADLKVAGPSGGTNSAGFWGTGRLTPGADLFFPWRSCSASVKAAAKDFEPLLAAREPRILPLVQFCQIRQAVYRELLGIALASRRQGFKCTG